MSTTTYERPVCTADNPAIRLVLELHARLDPRRGWSHPDAIEVGECRDGCCTDYRCPHCGYGWRYEWPD